MKAAVLYTAYKAILEVRIALNCSCWHHESLLQFYLHAAGVDSIVFQLHEKRKAVESQCRDNLLHLYPLCLDQSMLRA